MNQQCPSCGAPRDRAKRFCASCGLDYWRAAAGEAAPTAEPQPTTHATSSAPGPGLWLAAAGALLAVAAVVVTVIWVLPGTTSLPDRSEPAPTPLSEEALLIRSFFREARDPDAAFAVVGDSTLTVEGLPDPVPAITSTANALIHGEDWSGDVAVTQEGTPPFAATVAYVDGVAYVRPAGEAEWSRQTLPRAQLGPVNPFARISTVNEVQHIGSETVDGAELQHLRVTKWLGGSDFDDLLVNIAITDQSSTLDIWVTSEGIPVSADLVMDVEASDGVDTAQIRTVTRYEFSDWGRVEPITAPA
jgi:hypothetical protein